MSELNHEAFSVGGGGAHAANVVVAAPAAAIRTGNRAVAPSNERSISDERGTAVFVRCECAAKALFRLLQGCKTYETVSAPEDTTCQRVAEWLKPKPRDYRTGTVSKDADRINQLDGSFRSSSLSDAIDKKLGPARIPLAGHQDRTKHALGTTQNALRISGDTLVG